MDHAHRVHHQANHGGPSHAGHGGQSLNRIALVATLHCLLGCAVGEVAGLLIGTALGWSNGATIALAVGLAFLSGFGLTALPFLRRGYALKAALRIALAADAVSITIMEIVDNGLMLAIPGAMDAPVDSPFFWASMAAALAVAAVAAYPVNRWLIARGKGHALAHGHHQGMAGCSVRVRAAGASGGGQSGTGIVRIAPHSGTAPLA